MRILRIVSLASIVLAATSPALAQEVTCAAQIDRLANQYGLSANLPKAEPPQGDETAPRPQVTQDELKRSGGVIAPSTNPPARIISPNKDVDPGMATPRAEPARPWGESSSPDNVVAAKRTQMQGLIDAARQDEKRGNEEACREKVAQARALSEPG